MKKIKGPEFKKLIDKSKIIEQDGYGEKVLLAPDNIIVKIFRRKRLLSSALFRPYAKRFIKNAEKLKALEFITPVVTKYLYCKEFKRYLIYYTPLPGKTLREAFFIKPDTKLLKKLAEFIAHLHDKGVYFRSLHFGNIILMPEGDFGLIDISDTKIYPFRLSINKRVHNFRHIFRYKEDRDVVAKFGTEKFIDIYSNYTGFKEKHKKIFLRKFKAQRYFTYFCANP